MKRAIPQEYLDKAKLLSREEAELSLSRMRRKLTRRMEDKDISPLEADALSRMNPLNLTIVDGELLIGILKRKALDNNRKFDSPYWNPQKIGMVLWTYGR